MLLTTQKNSLILEKHSFVLLMALIATTPLVVWHNRPPPSNLALASSG